MLKKRASGKTLGFHLKLNFKKSDTMDTYETILVEIENKTAIITINREGKLNALNAQTLSDLSSALDSLELNTDVKGLVLTGAGQKAFVAGADIMELKGLCTTAASLVAEQGQLKVMDKLANFPKPVIAAVNGFALGGGLELAMACHIRVASVSAKFGLPEVSLGLIPGYGGTQRLTELVGKGKALEMIMTAEVLTAEEAFQWKLVNHVVNPDHLLPKCISILDLIYTRSAKAVSFAIKAVNAAKSQDGFKTEIALFGESFGTDESKEGIAAFLEKRKPNF